MVLQPWRCLISFLRFQTCRSEPLIQIFFVFLVGMNYEDALMMNLKCTREFSSAAKRETLEDTIRTVERYSRIIVPTHFESSVAKRVAMTANSYVINAGDGPGQLMDQDVAMSCIVDGEALGVAPKKQSAIDCYCYGHCSNKHNWEKLSLSTESIQRMHGSQIGRPVLHLSWRKTTKHVPCFGRTTSCGLMIQKKTKDPSIQMFLEVPTNKLKLNIAD
ncbi:unnamed protein product [Lactuca virosa]|uniref:Aspartate/ornithine carbamoyltransferase carbamoyl-P binding domain-containing protein n=1 Tax=Lactuca virosa TaxID=75947 RepID=A0AAU9NBG1_9ASTR|nr:unnamed protein product [Lactuca virosa]